MPSATVADVLEAIERLWPESGREDWDAVGLVSGARSHPVASILLAVDAVAATVDEAVDLGAQLLLTHHPLLLRGVTTIAEDRYKGSLLARLIRSGCALVAAHTNADVVETGTSGTLAARLGLSGVRPLVPSPASARGIGVVGTLPAPVSLGALARMLAQILPATASGIRVSGDFDRSVSTVALCAGAGDSLLAETSVLGTDVYVTSDLRHHPASEAHENALLGLGPALVDVSHWASEWLWLDVAAAELRELLPGVRIAVSELRTDPWDFVVMQ